MFSRGQGTCLGRGVGIESFYSGWRREHERASLPGSQKRDPSTALRAGSGAPAVQLLASFERQLGFEGEYPGRVQAPKLLCSSHLGETCPTSSDALAACFSDARAGLPFMDVNTPQAAHIGQKIVMQAGSGSVAVAVGASGCRQGSQATGWQRAAVLAASADWCPCP